MRKATLGVCLEGWPCIGLLAFSGLMAAILDWSVIAVIFWALTWFSLHFFRDPERVIPTGPGLAVSPADGRIVRVETRNDPITGTP